MKISPVPDLREWPHIRSAYKDGRLVIFFGAGLSAVWGCKRWKEMANFLINSCYEQGRFNFSIKDSLLSRYVNSPRKLITITKSILGENAFFEEIKKILVPSPDYKCAFPNLFNDLFALNAIYLTTNIDDNFSNLFTADNIFPDRDLFFAQRLRPKSLFHLHGHIKSPKSMVLTIDDYLSCYKNDRFKDFLKSIFCDESLCVLFLGYGVDEMEIIDFMIEKYGDETKKKRLNNHFYILLPFFMKEEQLIEYESHYFNKINMTIIPYSIDDCGYSQISNILGDWRKALTNRTEAFYDYSELIERNL
jgi:hypothetical protein